MQCILLRYSLAMFGFVVGCSLASLALAVDFESFEFNDANGTPLDMAVNTANPGNQWFEDDQMGSSQTQQSLGGRPGSYYIIKTSDTGDNNFLQIDDITSGTRYLTAKISGWNFQEVPNEQFRLGFLNGDTEPGFSNLITAQMSLVRLSTGDVELTGGALGPGSAPISSDVTFPAERTTPFEMTLALNKNSNTYKVFYRDGSGPSQVLGTGLVDPTRGGRAIRMQAGGIFGDFAQFFPSDVLDFFAVDRIALTDINPHTDLITLEVDRDNGAMTLRNTSGAAINGIESYSITSTAGGLNPANWTPIAGGTNTSSNAELMQTFAGTTSLANGQIISLSNASGAWLKSTFEDVSMVLNLAGDVTRTVNVEFIDNGGIRFMPGDFNFDNAITAADYLLLVASAESDLTSLSIAEAYRLGDLDGDKTSSLRDFVAFKELYDAANGGTGAFAAMLASIPEPSTVLLAGLAFAAALAGRRRSGRRIADMERRLFAFEQFFSFRGDAFMRRAIGCVGKLGMIAALVLVEAMRSEAAILEDFTFSEPDGTLLGDAENSANPGNSWVVSDNTVESSMLDGKFRIQKQSVTALASNYIDIANVTTTKAWLVADIAGWNFTATAAAEDVRFAFLDNDNAPPSGSTITAQMRIFRSGSALALEGTALGTGAGNIGTTYPLPLVQSNPFVMVLELDKTTDQYSVYYKDGAAPFALLGTPQPLGASTLNSGARDGNSVRFGFTGTFGDVGEFFDVDRIYLTDTSPITDIVDPVTLSLVVNTSSREVFIKNDTDDPIRFDSYRITSASESLSFSEWESLADRDPPLTPFDGPDLGNVAGDSPGELWTKSGGSDDGVLAESFLLSDTTLAADDMLSLGHVFKAGGTQDLFLQYHDAGTGAFYTVEATYVSAPAVAGDYNNDGTVDAADYTIWRDHLGSSFQLQNEGGISPGTVDAADYDFWKSRFGMTSGLGSASLSVVPEPGTLAWCVAVGLVTPILRRRRAA